MLYNMPDDELNAKVSKWLDDLAELDSDTVDYSNVYEEGIRLWAEQQRRETRRKVAISVLKAYQNSRTQHS